MRKFKSLFIGLALVLSASVSAGNHQYYNNPNAPDMGKWIFADGGSSAIWELHIIKNDGMDSHVKFRCSKLWQCWEAFDMAKYRSGNLNFAKKLWMERLSSKIYIVR
jgi:hypothetical protein